MSARQQFLPGANPGSSAHFTPDLENPLHAASGSAKKESFLGSGLALSGSSDDIFTHQRSGTNGLSNLMKKRSHPTMDSTPKNAPLRPGTADPYSKTYQNLHSNLSRARIPLVAPKPQVTYPSSLLFRSSSSNAFKVPSFVEHSSKKMKTVDDDAHISASDGSTVNDTSSKAENSSMLDRELVDDGSMSFSDIKFIPGSHQAGPRRVSIDDRTNNATISMTGHEINSDGRIRAVNDRKRSRDEADIDDGEYNYENPLKRFKPLQSEHNTNENRSVANASPRTERPSSGLSRSGDRHSLDMETHRSPMSQRNAYSASQSRHFSGSPPVSNLHARLEDHRPEEMGPFTKLLGQDPDLYLAQHMKVYDDLVNKWTNCTMEEWVAGANEVASKYYKILDYVKEHVSLKLRLYGSLHDTVNKHTLVLKDRENVLVAAKKKLVEESGSVLGK